jgi:PBP1b-binding outer membrane lipoprotein LpoB
MKKLLSIALLPFLLISCFGDSDDSKKESKTVISEAKSDVVETIPATPLEPASQTVTQSGSIVDENATT